MEYSIRINKFNTNKLNSIAIKKCLARHRSAPLTKDRKSFRPANTKKKFQIKNLNKERNACYFNDTLLRFLFEHKNSSHFFKICLPPEDSPWMKQAVVVSFEVFCTIIHFALSICH